MKLARLAIEKFLAHRETTLTLEEPVSVFVGANGSGKTSILDAVRALLTGTCGGVARGDAGILGHLGANWAVEATVVIGKAGATIRRTATTLSRIGQDGERIALKQADLDAKLLGGNRLVLDALLDVGKALDMTAADRKALIYRLARIEVTDEQLAPQIPDVEVRRPAVAGDWRKAEATAAEKKRAARRAADEVRAAAPEDPEVPLKVPVRASAVTDEMLGSVRRAAGALGDETRKLERQIGESAGRQAGSLDALRTGRAEVVAALSGCDEQEMFRAGKEAIDALEREAALLTATDGAVAKIATKLREVSEKHVRTANEILARQTAGEKHACPICGIEHEGAVDPSALDALRSTLAALEEEQAGLTAAKRDGEAARAKHVAAVRELQSRVDGHRAADQRAINLRKRLATYDEEIAAAEQADPIDMAELEAKLAEARGRAEKAAEILRAVDTYRNAVEAAEAEHARRQRLLAQADAWEAMEHACRPDGLPGKLIGPHLGPIRERLTTWTPLLGGLEVRLTDGCEVVVSRDGHPMRLSGSERWRVALALADALAQLSGLRFLALDEVAVLDPANRSALLGMLARIVDDYGQILVAAVPGDRPLRQAPARSGIRIYRVEDGMVTAVGEVEKGAAA